MAASQLGEEAVDGAASQLLADGDEVTQVGCIVKKTNMLSIVRSISNQVSCGFFVHHFPSEMCQDDDFGNLFGREGLFLLLCVRVLLDLGAEQVLKELVGMFQVSRGQPDSRF